MASPFAPFSAKMAKIRVGTGATTVVAKSWSVQSDSDELDGTNFESAGYFEPIAGGGIKKLTITIELDIDAAQVTFLFLGLAPGVTVSSLKLYLQNTTSPYWDIPYAFIKSATNPMNVKESGKMTIVLTGNGTFTPPTGSFVPV